MNIVIDASIAAAWSFADETTPDTERVASLVELYGAHVPQLFHLEIANVLMVAVRRGRISSGHADAQLALLEMLNLRVDGATAEHAWHKTLQLAGQERLTVYDATYLELALRVGADLATLDSELAAAARRNGLTVLP